MNSLKNFLIAGVAGAGAVMLSAPAYAGVDLYMINGQVFPVDEFTNTTIQAGPNAVEGDGVTLWDHDLFNTEAGNPNQSNSDYIYVHGGLIYFSSDTETQVPPNPPLGPPVNRLQETGQFQDVSRYFDLAPGTFFVLSDVPEPATWAMMLAGFGLAGAALRRGRDRVASSLV